MTIRPVKSGKPSPVRHAELNRLQACFICSRLCLSTLAPSPVSECFAFKVSALAPDHSDSSGFALMPYKSRSLPRMWHPVSHDIERKQMSTKPERVGLRADRAHTNSTWLHRLGRRAPIRSGGQAEIVSAISVPYQASTHLLATVLALL